MDQNQIQEGRVIQEVRSEELYLGPLPEPEIMEKYKITDKSFPERIMKMAEAHNAADVRAKNRLSLANLIIPIAGQVFTLLLGAGGILSCIFLSRAGDLLAGRLPASLPAFPRWSSAPSAACGGNNQIKAGGRVKRGPVTTVMVL
jgi:hypothetical protein